ncbi:Murein DD-endopeptidase MepM and murein hydrolase activator NlpD, contain LysM domain [Palleronia marisminoris]|uniref:Murein DD-endopeptidase MepM n=1 Tax=Palleronia marisminoris TaxID=315423 RepID=A0A1Y5RHR3_9RHOB|nr:M23 family metallopeptidase [Palleronia marisminoris]SFG21118.1 Murein DD-endopeptidase MepM and murein hydrolase activator NlpD, contain LysM domain [Palleronia marisminoris]SLN17380.1 Murein DD-endopeptidase MepM [Palleronia marisminoris]
MARAFPERRLFLRSDTETRFVRLSPSTQAIALSGSALVVGWTILASAVVLMDSVASDDLRDNAAREQAVYENRLNAMSTERDQAFAEARAAQERFTAALDQISDMQSELLDSETRREELEQGMEIAHAKLRDAIVGRDAALAQKAQLASQVEGEHDPILDGALLAEYQTTIDLLAGALDSTASQRDDMAGEAEEAEQFAEEMILEAQLKEDRNDRIFAQLEDALTISVEPLDKMFRSAGLDTGTLLNSVRRGYSGQGGPLSPISFSTKGEAPDEASLRANGILERLDEMNLYRLAATKAPFALPIMSNFRFTSGFGPRWGRMHQGTDFAGAHGTPIHTTADGTVSFAGRQSGYGNLVKIKHDFGIETRYAHMSAIHVKVGQRVSRGDRIGDMGNTGRSTGTHLHYEVRVGGKPVNPMTYIKAARNVF